MGTALFSLAAGFVFGIGLALSQMVDPAKVIGFLDVAGTWDPSLAFVMGTALCVAAAGVRLERIVKTSTASAAIASSKPCGIDARLILGACVFGLGWGLAGFCPGPAIAALITGSGKVLLWRLLPIGNSIRRPIAPVT